MKAVLHTQYGPPDELQLREIDMPVPKDNEVRIKVHATTVTSTDCNLRNLTFLPPLLKLPMRLQFGLLKPNTPLLGMDLAGEIESVGKDVTRFRVGDQVYGTPEPAIGTYAQYICMPEDGVLIKKPESLTLEEAATLPLAGHTAIFFLKDQVEIMPGDEVLIVGASGAIGTFAVQLAKYLGAEVSGVCSTANVELVKSLGADRVIDYKKADFTKSGQTYDVIFDVVHKSSFLRCKNSLKEKGTYLVTMPSLTFLLQTLWASFVGRKKSINGAREATLDDLLFFNELIETGKLRTVIDRRYPLEEITEAFRYVEKGHKKGNVVITINHH